MHDHREAIKSNEHAMMKQRDIQSDCTVLNSKKGLNLNKHADAMYTAYRYQHNNAYVAMQI